MGILWVGGVSGFGKGMRWKRERDDEVEREIGDGENDKAELGSGFLGRSRGSGNEEAGQREEERERA